MDRSAALSPAAPAAGSGEPVDLAWAAFCDAERQELAQAGRREVFEAGYRAAPARAEPAGWLPIESAPKDGTDVLLWFVREWSRMPSLVIAGYFDNGETSGWATAEREDEWVTGEPTHWQPLPDAPRALPDASR